MWVNRLIRKLRLISKSMTSQSGQKIVTTLILLNISRINGNQAIKFGQFKEYNVIFFCKNHTENEAKRLVSDLSVF